MTGLPLAFVASLLLGMRHATDADHVVAVSTIVSRERSLVRAGGIGVIWGLGHTLQYVNVVALVIEVIVAPTGIPGPEICMPPLSPTVDGTVIVLLLVTVTAFATLAAPAVAAWLSV